jgi:molecular chaperone GrpE
LKEKREKEKGQEGEKEPLPPPQEPQEKPREEGRQELVETLQRLQAEFENYKKRVEKENAEYCLLANGQLIRELLPVLDNFELALGHVKPEEKQDGGLSKGMELIYAQLVSILEANGVTPIQPAEGERFDPYCHEAMLTEQKEGVERNTILEVLQRGYMLRGRVLRTAKVKVTK